MSITSDLLYKTIRCCLKDYNHIVDKYAVILNCCGNACKNCINDSDEDKIYCYNCNNKHNVNDIIKCPPNASVLLLINSCSNELIEGINRKINETFESFKGEFAANCLP